MNEPIFCTACKMTDLREFHGDLTCINCGLVKQTHMIDDTCNDTSYLYNDNELIPVIRKNQHIPNPMLYVSKDETQIIRFKSVLEMMALDDKINELALEWFPHTQALKVTPKKLNYIFGVCIYCASIYNQRGISIHFIASKLQLSHTTIYKFLPKVLEAWSSKPWYKTLTSNLSTHRDKLKRMLYSLQCIPSDKAFTVLKPSRELYNKICNCPQLNSVKSYTLIACCIFIGALIAGVKLQRTQFCKEVGISMPTLKSHERTIQQSLVNANRTL
jgi:transcription initiation factor TFIIIB Brf1 subunit/transcription initiation factor TFIIB